jgi:glutamine synthetase
MLYEYVWIDGNETLRSKNRILHQKPDLLLLPMWNFDGSSTNQATGTVSDIILKPVRVYKNPFIDFIESYLVLCECYDSNMTPHITNTRKTCEDMAKLFADQECLFGIEQEYTIFERNTNNLSAEGCNLPYGWKQHHNPEIGGQGPYYCSIGGDRNFGRNISVEHLKLCLDAGIQICGTNAEVMASQWEYQIGVCDPLRVCDDLWMSRYILQRITEKYNCYVSFHPKPYKGNWNGTGGHTNFSTKKMRQDNGIDEIYRACAILYLEHNAHMKVYGKHNEERLTGLHETSNPSEFTYGIGDRSCSVRIPIHVFNDKKGYLEDRRPASNLDPYMVVRRLILTVCD